MGPGEFIAEDFNDLVSYEHRKRVSPVAAALSEVLGSFDQYDGYYWFIPFDGIHSPLFVSSAFTDLATLASSIVSSIHLPDPSESGLFNAPIRPRRRIYQTLSGNFTYVQYVWDVVYNTADSRIGDLSMVVTLQPCSTSVSF